MLLINMKKLSQKERIKKRLLEVGHISRNDCIRNYITRLSAYILELKQEGWDFETKEVNGDYIYTATKTPFMIAKYTLSNGIEIIKKILK